MSQRAARPPGSWAPRRKSVDPHAVAAQGTTGNEPKGALTVSLTLPERNADDAPNGARPLTALGMRKRMDKALAAWRRLMLDPARFDATGRAMVRAELMAASIYPAEITSNSARLLAKLDAELSDSDWYALACLLLDVQATGRAAAS